MSSMLGCGGILLWGLKLLVVGVGVEGNQEGMREKDIMPYMFAAKVNSHLMLFTEAYEVIYVVM